MPKPKGMTVQQLREHLAQFDPEMWIFAEWEGVWAPVLARNFRVEDGAVVVNVDEY